MKAIMLLQEFAQLANSGVDLVNTDVKILDTEYNSYLFEVAGVNVADGAIVIAADDGKPTTKVDGSDKWGYTA
jgi:hypothetical protein